ncbi:cell division protein ZapA [Autumnicola edwardsiae]|jgi:cell division protein ZapA|uniref:Cell division protein ZapA n=1 Tax=Autumnicola edwardsiae TaxID=3075594 RepID=A0ABU3CW79_9FLAO|nr:cell division protein ZapA [Zunongwangia sp. F297]MDT0650609.1 cell division protein ZapA [Zunongwangia sp. F297]
MADKLKIKISIADRVYPLTIQPKQEEGLRKAAKKIEGMIKQFEQSYAVRDKQDVLAMCALQFAAQTEQQGIDKSSEMIEAEDKLKSLNELLHKHLAT